MKKFTLIICALLLSLAGFSQVNSYPETGPGACNGSANIYGPYNYGDLYNVNDSLTPMQTNSMSFYSLCAGNYFVKVYDSLGYVTSYNFTITTDLCGGFNAYSYPNQVSAPGMCDGSAGLNINGGTAPYNFMWSNGQTTQNATGLCEGNYNVQVTDMNSCSTNVSVTITAPSPCQNFFVDIQPFAVSDSGMCDGAAKAWPQNGAAPYTYSWSNSATTDSIGGLCAGNYSVTVIDSLGCQYTQYIDILINNPCQNFYVNTQPFAVSDSGMCDGSAKVIPYNGLAPFTYLWTNNATTDSISGLCEGNYNVTVTDANNCSTNGSVYINIYDPCQGFYIYTNAVPSTDSLACNGSASVTVNGGTAPFTYNWSNAATTQNISNLCPGYFNVTVTDVNGCNQSYSINVGVDSLNGGPCGNFYLNMGSNPTSDSLNCNGSVNAYVSGGMAPFTYVWNTGDSLDYILNKCEGEYSVTVTDNNGCVKTGMQYVGFNPNGNPCQNFNVTVNSAPSTDTVNCNGSANVVINGGTPPYSFQWNTGDSSQNIYNKCPGNYSVMVTDYNGCNSNPSVYIAPDSGNTNPCQNFQINLVSYPITDTVNCNGSVEVNTINGMSPYTYLWNDSSTNNNILGICIEGEYSVTVTDNNGCVITQSAFVGKDSLNPACANLTFNVNFVDATGQGLCDGTASAVPAGGSGNYGYSWSTGDTLPNISGLCAGTYTAYMIDFTNNCQKNFTFGIADSGSNPCQNPPVVTISGPTQIMVGQSATLTASGAQYYNWSTGDSLQTITVNPSTTSSYEVTGVDSLGCSGVANITITVLPDTSNPCVNFAATLTTTNASDVSCVGTATASANGSGNYSFAWSDSSLSGANVISLCAGSYTVTVTDLSNGCAATASASVGVDSSANPCLGFQVIIDSTLNETAPTAGDGQVFASIYGGTSPFQYNWGNGLASDTAYFSGMYGGSFNLVVTDANGCTSTANGYVGTTAPTTGPCAGVIVDVTITASSTLTSTCNVLISSTVSGGTAPYAYVWNDGYMTSNYVNACAGVYSLQVKDVNGCLGAATVLINSDTTAPVAPIVVNIATVNNTDSVNCNGSVRVNVSGGVAPYVISYNTGAAGPQLTGLCDDIYEVTVTDANGDSSLFSFVIADSSNIFTSSANNPLNDSVIVATVTADAVEDCLIDFANLDSVYITNYWEDVATGMLTVEWTFYSSVSGNVMMYSNYSVGPDGVYEVTFTLYCSGRGTKGFVKAYDKVQVNNRLSSVISKNTVKAEVYPNPFNTTLNVKLVANSNVVISDVTGKVVSSFKGLSGNNSILVENLSKGIYFVTIQSNNSQEVFKVVKE